MRNTFSGVMLFFLMIGVGYPGDLTTTRLSPAQQKEFDSLAQSFRVAACDSVPLAEALVRKPTCRTAVYLAPFAQWLVGKGKTLDECMKDCNARCESMAATKRYAIDLSDLPVAGDRRAPVTVVIYISAMCPLCKYLASEMYREVTDGALKGKAALAAKPFTTGPGDRALAAAGKFKKYWEYIIALNNIKMRPDAPLLVRVADSLGMPAAFKNLLTDTTIKQKLEGFRAEGGRNEVTVTPTVFINGKRYHSYKAPHWVVDAVLYEYEMIKTGR